MTDKTERHECPNCAHWLTITRPEVDNTALKLIEQMAGVLDMLKDGGPEEGTPYEDWARNMASWTLTAYEEFKKGYAE